MLVEHPFSHPLPHVPPKYVHKSDENALHFLQETMFYGWDTTRKSASFGGILKKFHAVYSGVDLFRSKPHRVPHLLRFNC